MQVINLLKVSTIRCIVVHCILIESWQWIIWPFHFHIIPANWFPGYIHVKPAPSVRGTGKWKTTIGNLSNVSILVFKSLAYNVEHDAECNTMSTICRRHWPLVNVCSIYFVIIFMKQILFYLFICLGPYISWAYILYKWCTVNVGDPKMTQSVGGVMRE